MESEDTGDQALAAAQPAAILPEPPLEAIERLQLAIDNTKTTAAAKADAIESRIAAVGGEPSAAVREALEKLRASL